MRPQLSFEGTTKTNKKLLWNQHTIKFDIGGVQKCKKKNHIQNQTFLRHYVKKLKKNGDKSKYSILNTPYLKPFAMLVSNSFCFGCIPKTELGPHF